MKAVHSFVQFVSLIRSINKWTYYIYKSYIEIFGTNKLQTQAVTTLGFVETGKLC